MLSEVVRGGSWGIYGAFAPHCNVILRFAAVNAALAIGVVGSGGFGSGAGHENWRVLAVCKSQSMTSTEMGMNESNVEACFESRLSSNSAVLSSLIDRKDEELIRKLIDAELEHESLYGQIIKR